MNHILRLKSTSPDVVSYRMYYKLSSDSNPVSTEDSFVEFLVNADGKYNLFDYPEIDGVLDGEYKVAFTSVDDANLEGPLGEEQVVLFDFVPPNPPTAVFSDV